MKRCGAQLLLIMNSHCLHEPFIFAASKTETCNLLIFPLRYVLPFWYNVLLDSICHNSAVSLALNIYICMRSDCSPFRSALAGLGRLTCRMGQWMAMVKFKSSTESQIEDQNNENLGSWKRMGADQYLQWGSN